MKDRDLALELLHERPVFGDVGAELLELGEGRDELLHVL